MIVSVDVPNDVYDRAAEIHILLLYCSEVLGIKKQCAAWDRAGEANVLP